MPAGMLVDLDDDINSDVTIEQSGWTDAEPLPKASKHEVSTVPAFNPWTDAATPTSWDVSSVNAAAQSQPSAWDILNDNDWGDFEKGEPSAGEDQLEQSEQTVIAAPRVTSTNKVQRLAANDLWQTSDESSVVHNASRPSALATGAAQPVFTGSAYFPRPQSIPEVKTTKLMRGLGRSGRTTPKDDNVLFDAEDASDEDEGELEGEEDDFGDYEGAQAPTAPLHDHEMEVGTSLEPTPHTNRLISLLDEPAHDATSVRDRTAPSGSSTIASSMAKTADLLGDLDATFNTPSTAQSGLPLIGSSPHESVGRGGTAGPAARAPNVASIASQIPDKGDEPRIILHKLAPNVPIAHDSDTWADWDDEAATGNASSSAMDRPSDAIDFPTLFRSPTVASMTAPTNVPPPALLLALFGSLINTIQTDVLQRVNETSQADKAAAIQGPSAQKCLQSIFTVGMVLGHIIAGRKLRWKRDNLLSQSMRIGQAGSKSTGMKLASIDKTEDAREEQAVSQVVRAWHLHAGKLRIMIASAGITEHLPDVVEGLPVRTAQASEGAISSSKQCILCGLKRNERVHKVDVNIDDTFGEWWIEHWGHKTCKMLWDSEEPKLRSR